ncbi:MAG TPA: cupin domain-containing protein [Paenibacillus sp.]|nr:cupin domain-containing protein [Paenibacillus sp.]
MTLMKETKVLTGDAMTWDLMPNHIELYHREIVSAAEADAMGIRMSSILWEKIGVGGQVLPHYHDVVEVIHITVGKVKLLLAHGEWKSYKAGDTFQVPAGVLHSVANDGDTPSEQISIFVPVDREAPANSFFNTTLVEDVYSRNK